MKREILINGGPRETRVAILEDDRLVELLVDRPDQRRRVGDIYKGRVNKVLPGMDAALFRALADDITVEARSSDIDLDNASPMVKRAFEAAAQRDVGSVTRAAPPPSGEPAFEGSLMHVRAIAVTAASGVFVREGVVEGPFDRQGTPTVLRLVQGSLRADELLPTVGAAPSCAEGFVLVQRLAE